MERFHARYPFLRAAREAVGQAGVDLAALVGRDESPVVDRAVDRVTTAIGEGRVGQAVRDPRTELLSYPVARVIVSIVDDDDLIHAYAAAEAATARERFEADFQHNDRRSERDWRVTVDRLLREFDLAGSVARDGDGYRVDVGPYLRLAGELDGREWRLPRRSLSDGSVPVTETELHALLEEAVRERVAEGLPIPDVEIAGLESRVDRIERSLADTTPPRGIDLVAPGRFPPCVAALLDRVRDGEDLPPHSELSLVAFLAGTGMDPGEVARLCERPPDAFEHRLERIAGENGVEYPMPSCATMQAYGDCVDKDDLCERIDHPLAYYERRIEDDDPTDWREATADGE